MASNHPWEKEPSDLSQFDWLTAVGLSPDHREKPTDLRAAQEMMRFTSGSTCLAWPTVETLALYIGCHRVSASRSISNLKRSGALEVICIADLPDNLRDEIKRKGRGNAYGLNIGWAAEVFAVRSCLKRKEPEAMKNGRLVREGNVAETFTLPVDDNVTASATLVVAAPATLECNAGRYTNIQGEIERYRDRGNEGVCVPLVPLPILKPSSAAK